MIVFQGTLLTAGDQVCQLSSIPDDINAAAIEDSGEAVANKTANTTISKEEESIKYELKINSGNLTDEEKRNMTESMKKACGDKEIEKITIKTTDADNFNRMANGEIVAVDVPTQISRRRQGGCTNLTVTNILSNHLKLLLNIDIVHLK